MTDVKGEFDAYRVKAVAGNEETFAAMEAGYAVLKAFVAEDWPEIAVTIADDSAKWREVERGHRDGSLERLGYRVGTEALGHREYSMTYNRDSRAWSPARRASW